MLTDEEYMEKALALAGKAAEMGEIPVGAIVVDKDGEIIAEAFNERETLISPTAHAEILAIERASKALKNRRLSECTLYVTLEPCPMCAGAVINAQIKRLVYGAFDEKNGACASVAALFDEKFTHIPRVRSRVLEEKCGKILSEFFGNLRDKQNKWNKPDMPE
ncbi:MAG: tRNA adenosine(34) deaminase TadA [Oscillospiraceae bacterium]|nr:tRNA adenosine(34) deaminase TadA [Oscillospiraceae bacterium]